MPLGDWIIRCARALDGRTRRVIHDDIREELSFHLASAIEEKERCGMTTQAARDAASDEFGDRSSIESQCRSVQSGERAVLQGAQVGLMLITLASLVFVAFSFYKSRLADRSALKGIQHSMNELHSNLATLVDRAPPVVVSSFPQSGDIDVDPSEQSIRVTFSKMMMDRSWSWCRTDSPFPESTGDIHYVDGRTCVMPVHLLPETEYVIQINSPNFRNFKDSQGRSAEPYLLCFRTGPSSSH